MTELLGKSVGEWTSNPYVNMFGMYGGGTNPLNTFRDKACSKFIVSPQMCNMKLSEWSSRSSANASLKKYGLSQAEIEQAWTEFKEQVQEEFDRTKFINFAKSKVQSESDNQGQTSAGASPRGRNNTDVNTDRNGNPTTGDNGGQSSGGGSTSPKRNTNTSTTSNTTPKAKSNTNLYLYGGIGLAVIVGAFLIFRKK